MYKLEVKVSESPSIMLDYIIINNVIIINYIIN